ncbi:MAG: hypothetical protein IJ860_10435 [Eubacterium sp.]|nr:hypothetical protein [Eubacterium sp.]
MNRWNTQDGLFHFLFANEDRYILDSMVSLNLTDYLRRELTKRHFQDILFIEGLQGSFIVRVFNERTWRWVTEQIKGLFGFGLKGGAEYHVNPGGCRIQCSADQIRKLPAQATGTAFVFAIDTFSEIYRGRAEELDVLRQSNAHRKNVIILRASTTAEDSQPLLTDPDGIFQAKTAHGDLFPAVVSAFQNEDLADEGCYVLLGKTLGNRCVFLNEFTHGAIRKVIRYVAWVVREDVDHLTPEQTEKLDQFIFRWYHDADLQVQRQELFSQNHHNQYALLGRELARNWDKITEAARNTRADSVIVNRIHELGVISEQMIVKYTPEIRYEWQYDPKRQIEYRAVTSRVRRLLQKPRRVKPDPEAEKYLRGYIDHMNAAIKLGDTETVYCAERCIEEAVARKFDCGEGTFVYWNCDESQLKEYERLFQCGRKFRELQDEQQQRRAEFSTLYRQIQQMREGSEERKHAMVRIVDLNKDIERYDKLLTRNRLEEQDIENRIDDFAVAAELLRHKDSVEDAKRAGQLLQDLSVRIREAAEQEKAFAKGLSLDDVIPDVKLDVKEPDNLSDLLKFDFGAGVPGIEDGIAEPVPDPSYGQPEMPEVESWHAQAVAPAAELAEEIPEPVSDPTENQSEIPRPVPDPAEEQPEILEEQLEIPEEQLEMQEEQPENPEEQPELSEEEARQELRKLIDTIY